MIIFLRAKKEKEKRKGKNRGIKREDVRNNLILRKYERVLKKEWRVEGEGGGRLMGESTKVVTFYDAVTSF